MSPPKVPPEVLQLARQLKSFAAPSHASSHILSDYAYQVINHLVLYAVAKSYPVDWAASRRFQAVVARFEAHIDQLNIDLKASLSKELDIDAVDTIPYLLLSVS
jgi:hypothetical protein